MEVKVLTKKEKQTWDFWCKKSKKICAICETKLAGRKPPKEFKRKIWCSHVTYKHPLYKSKIARICGECARG